MSFLRQGRHFLMIGMLQWLTDWGLMVGLSHLGVSVALANIAGRIGGAALGFWLNGRITFADESGRPGWRALMRYSVVWSALAFISTLAVTTVGSHFGLNGAWIGKPIIDATLSVVSFMAMRHWVYR